MNLFCIQPVQDRLNWNRRRLPKTQRTKTELKQSQIEQSQRKDEMKKHHAKLFYDYTMIFGLLLILVMIMFATKLLIF